MMKLPILFLFLTFTVCRGWAATSFQTVQDPCPDAITQDDLNKCADNQFKKADLKLNIVYKRIFKHLNPEDKKNLIVAQKAWLRYRNATCVCETTHHGGSMSPMIYSFCLERTTLQRIKELNLIFEEK